MGRRTLSQLCLGKRKKTYLGLGFVVRFGLRLGLVRLLVVIELVFVDKLGVPRPFDLDLVFFDVAIVDIFTADLHVVHLVHLVLVPFLRRRVRTPRLFRHGLHGRPNFFSQHVKWRLACASMAKDGRRGARSGYFCRAV